MNIALVGYGKMGHAIEKAALQRGHEIVLRIGTANRHELSEPGLKHADIAIEFTRPEAAQENVLLCLKTGIPVVSGTTGWNGGLAHASIAAISHGTAFLHASNFSIGVNIFFEVNRLLATLMNDQPDYDILIEEIHHTEKKDAPSGTAITLAEQVIEEIKRKHHWTKEITGDKNAIPIISRRLEDVPGTHSVKYRSAVDDIEIIHTAHNREGFAKGAVLAAEFLYGKKGVFTMKDVLGINRP